MFCHADRQIGSPPAISGHRKGFCKVGIDSVHCTSVKVCRPTRIGDEPIFRSPSLNEAFNFGNLFFENRLRPLLRLFEGLRRPHKLDLENVKRFAGFLDRSQPIYRISASIWLTDF